MIPATTVTARDKYPRVRTHYTNSSPEQPHSVDLASPETSNPEAPFRSSLRCFLPAWLPSTPVPGADSLDIGRCPAFPSPLSSSTRKSAAQSLNRRERPPLRKPTS